VAGPFRALGLGDRFQTSVLDVPLWFQVVAIRDRFPGLPVGRPFIVASFPQVVAAAPHASLPPTAAFLAAPGTTGSALEQLVTRAAPDAVVVDRSAEAAALEGQGVVEVASGGLLALAALAAVYATLAVIATLLLTAADRRQESAHLRAFGLTDRQSAALLAGEFTPAVLVAAAFGLGLGIAMFVYLLPGLGLTTLLGVSGTAPPTVDLGTAAILFGLVLGILGVSMLLGVAAERSASGQAVRGGL
jgi:putative ABC transport system permease protein